MRNDRIKVLFSCTFVTLVALRMAHLINKQQVHGQSKGRMEWDNDPRPHNELRGMLLI